MDTNEREWQDWVLGVGKYKKAGPRHKKSRPNVGYGVIGQKPIPDSWWQRLEARMLKDGDDLERKVPVRNRIKARLPHEKQPTSIRLSPHFMSGEFDCHNGQRVPVVAIPALRRLCLDFLEPMRAEFGPCHVLSGYRPRVYNAAIGGAKYSQHIYELTPGSVASDTFYARGNPSQWAVKARQIAHRKGIGGVGQYNKQGFVHIDNGPRRNWP